MNEAWMRVTKLMVISPSDEIEAVLRPELEREGLRIETARPGPCVLRALRRERPAVAVIDRIDQRPEAAQLEIALLKELNPQARVIAVSGNSSDTDALVIEQGVFCYVVAPRAGELVRLIRAAAAQEPIEDNGSLADGARARRQA